MERRQAFGQFALAATVAISDITFSNDAAARASSNDSNCSPPWRRYNTPASQEYLHRAARLPKVPDRSIIPENETAEFDYLAARVQGFKGAEVVDGEGYAMSEWAALAASPPLGGELSCFGRIVIADQGTAGALGDYEHEIIDEALALDANYYFLPAGHTPGAIASGWRIEALEALRDHRDDLLTNDELLIVKFVRAVRDGSMTDAIWGAMRKRMGNERAVIDYVSFVCLLDMHHRFYWAVGGPEMSRENFTKMLNEFRSGVRKTPPAPKERRDIKIVPGGPAAISAAKNPASLECPPWHTYYTPRNQEYLKRSERLPKIPTRIGVTQDSDRDLIAWDDRGDYEHLLRRIEELRKGKDVVDGEPAGVPLYNAFAASPRNGACLSRFEIALSDRDGKPNTIGAYERELTAAIYDLDSGYYGFLALHTPFAIAAGIRVEALEALRDHQDDKLTKIEMAHVRFIRAVRDGKMTDAIWDDMKRRLGSERGVVEYTYLVVLRNAFHQFSWSVGAPEMPRDDYKKMLADFKSGNRAAPHRSA
jgi:hypothetical protein